MTKILSISFLFLITTSNLKAQWEVQLDNQNFTHLDRIFFLDENYGWAIGGATIGAVSPYFYTTDGGQNWYLDDDWWNIQGTDIVFVNPDTGFIAAPNGIIRKTLDGGETWTDIQTPAIQNVMRLFFVDENNGWATLGQYNEGYIIYTEDDGDNWELQEIFYNSYYTVNDIYFIDDKLGWTAGLSYSVSEDYNSIKRTIDSGENWITLDSASFMYFEYMDIFFTDSLNGWIVGSNYNEYLIIHTVDGGETWQEQIIEEPSETSIVNCVFFVNDTTGWMGVGEAQTTNPYGAIYFTNDGGENWQLQQEFYKAILDIQMINQDTGWAVGADYIYHTTNGDTIISVGTEENLPKKDLIKINPNPFNNIIQLQIPEKYQLSKIIIADITGKICYRKNENINNNVDLSFLQKGVYFLSIQFNSNNQFHSLTKKIIKL